MSPVISMRALARRLRADQAGAAVMEFGIIFVVFVTMLIGMFDIGQGAYAQAVLNGAVSEAARSSSLETADTSAADAKVASLIGGVAPGATITSTRLSYYDFADIERPEQWNDEDADGLCNNDEAYTDENANGQWDADIGVAGNGTAGDVVIYTVNVSYEPLFPIPFYDDADSTRNLKAVTVKKNQPFRDQPGYGSAAGVCA